MDYRKKLGEWGEEEAIKLLKKKGYQILARNYRTRYGEIDIIARDHNYLVFIEVKTRKFGEAADAVDQKKQEKMLKAAELYLIELDQSENNLRFDCIALVQQAKGFTIKHFLDIIEAT